MPFADRLAGRGVDSRQSIWKPDYSVFRCGQDQPGIDQRPLPNACGQQAPIPSDTVWHAANRYGTPSSPFDRLDVIGRPSPLRPRPKYHCRMADAPSRIAKHCPIVRTGPRVRLSLSAYEGTPPWDIGRPQPAFLAVARSGALVGRVLDVGCGTGEHALMAAELGLDATGIDFSPKAIRLAENKARARSLDPRFLVADALELESRGGRYDTVLDCGLFHVSDRDRARSVRSLSSIVVPDLVYFMLCRATNSPATGDHGESVEPRFSRASPMGGARRRSKVPRSRSPSTPKGHTPGWRSLPGPSSTQVRPSVGCPQNPHQCPVLQSACGQVFRNGIPL